MKKAHLLFALLVIVVLAACTDTNQPATTAAEAVPMTKRDSTLRKLDAFAAQTRSDSTVVTVSSNDPLPAETPVNLSSVFTVSQDTMRFDLASLVVADLPYLATVTIDAAGEGVTLMFIYMDNEGNFAHVCNKTGEAVSRWKKVFVKSFNCGGIGEGVSLF